MEASGELTSPPGADLTTATEPHMLHRMTTAEHRGYQQICGKNGWMMVVAADQRGAMRKILAATPEEQARVCVIAGNYGEAGAIEFYGPSLGLSVPVLSGHNSYFVWGPHDCTGETMISIGYPLRDVINSFESVEAAGSVSCEYCMPLENGIQVYILRGLKFPMQEAWPTTKKYD